MLHTRHNGVFTIPDNFDVTIVGVGGIGAVTALCLAKMGVKYMTIYDFDDVGVENMATQLLKVSGVGNPKVQDVTETLFMFSDEINLLPIRERMDETSNLIGDLVVCCVDTIEARQKVFYASSNARWFLDTRMSAMEYQHFLVDMTNEDAYNAYKFSLFALNDENVPDAPCTEKATFFTAMIAAGNVGNVVKGIVTNDIVSHRLVQNIKTDFLMKIPL